MENRSRLLLAELLNRGYKPEFYTILSEDMFDNLADRKVFKALKSGYKFSLNDIAGLREVAGLTITETVDIVTLTTSTKGWITEQDILDFTKQYNDKKIRECLEGGNIEAAFKYLKSDTIKQSSVIEDYKRHLTENRIGADSGLLGLPTGILDLDRVTSGFRKSKVWIIGGYNAYGKSYFLTNMVNKIIDMNKRACVITLEMTKEDVMDRMIGERLGIGVYELAKTVNAQVVATQVENLDKHIKDLDLCILDSTYDIKDIETKLRIENKNRHIDVLFIDFIQLIQNKNSKSSYEVLSGVATKLQELTKELGICSVILSQISNEAQKDTEYMTYGFKGAGEIGQVADVAIRILRTRDKTTGIFTEEFILDVVKNRSGQTGQVVCRITFPSGSIVQVNKFNTPQYGQMD